MVIEKLKSAFGIKTDCTMHMVASLSSLLWNTVVEEPKGYKPLSALSLCRGGMCPSPYVPSLTLLYILWCSFNHCAFHCSRVEKRHIYIAADQYLSYSPSASTSTVLQSSAYSELTELRATQLNTLAGRCITHHNATQHNLTQFYSLR